MASKNALVVVRRSPADDIHAEEGLRVAVGLTLAFSEVTVLLLDGGVDLLAPGPGGNAPRGDALRHWQTLGELGATRLVEKESLLERGLDVAPGGGIDVVPRSDLDRIFAGAGTVGVF